MRLPQAAENNSQHRVCVCGCAHSGPRIRSHALLVNNNRGRQTFQNIDVRARLCGHESLNEGAIGLIDQSLRFRRDRSEGERTLTRTGNSREYGHPALRDLDTDVLEVVYPSALHPDEVVAVCHVRCGGRGNFPRGHLGSVSSIRLRLTYDTGVRAVESRIEYHQEFRCPSASARPYGAKQRGTRYQRDVGYPPP